MLQGSCLPGMSGEEKKESAKRSIGILSWHFVLTAMRHLKMSS